MKDYIDPIGIVEDYLHERDWENKENSNQGFSFSSLLLRAGNEIIRHYCLNKLYKGEIAEAYKKGAIHIHDLGFGIIPYCSGWDLRDLLKMGFGIRGRVCSGPAKHLDTLVNQIVNFLGTLQNEFAGAQAISHLDTFLAPYVRKDGLDYRKVKQLMQNFIYHLNITSRWGCQTPFSNITLDIEPPDYLASQHVIVGGEVLSSTYEDYEEERLMIVRAIVENMLEGDINGRVFTFPIITYNITKDFPFDTELADLIFKLTGKFGTGYFQNYIGSGLDPNTIYAMCCRLQLDKTQLQLKGFGFVSNEKTGSIGVKTINLAYVAREANGSYEKFFELLEYYMELCKKGLEIKRKIINENLRRGLQPYAKKYVKSYDNYFSTIGIIGMHEALLNLGIEDGIVDPQGHAMAIEILKFMREKIVEFQEETGNLYNLEAVPGESCCHSLALRARKVFPDIKLSGTKKRPYLTNSTWLPVGATDDLAFIIKHQEPLQRLYTGGTVLHLWMGEALNSEEVRALVEKVCRSRIPYFSITPVFSICKEHGYISGYQEVCPYCGTRTEVWSRITGYYTELSHWNDGKVQEFMERKLIYKNKVFKPAKYDISEYVNNETRLLTDGGRRNDD